MTGGRMRAEQWDCPQSRRVAVARSEDERGVDLALQAWLRAMRFSRRAGVALRPCGLSFALFRVLETTERLQREMRDAVSQQEVARECSLAKSSTCSLMRLLEKRALVDIGFDQWGFAQRIIVTKRGHAVLANARPAIAIAARESGLVL